MPKKYAVKVVAAKDDAPAEILVHGPIGASFWSDDGITGKDFTDALNAIPRGQKVVVGINSQGGSVGEGLAIYNAIQRRSEDVTARIDGYALSIASFFPLAASKVVSPKSSIWMIHNAWSWSQGNANQLRKDADLLDTHDRTLIQAYAAKTGKSEKEIADAMEEETWLTGEEAIAWGLADEEGGDIDASAFAELDFRGAVADTFKNLPVFVSAGFRSVGAAFTAFKTLSAQQGGAEKPKTKNEVTMNRTEIIALLKTWGVNVADNATDEWLKAELAKGKPEAKPELKPEPKQPDNIIALQQKVDAMEKQMAAANENAIRAAVNGYVEAGRIPKEKADNWVKRAMADSTVLDDLKEGFLIQRDQGGLPVKDNTKFAGGGKIAREEINKRKAGKERMEFLRDNWNELIQGGVPLLPRQLPLAANTTDTALTTDMLASTTLTVLQNRLAPLSGFSRNFGTDRIKPLAEIQVPIVTAGGTAQTNATTFEDTTNFVNTIDNRPVQPARLTAGAHITAAELNSGFTMQQVALQKSHEIADAIQAAVNAVITLANFPNPTAAGLVFSTANFGHDELGQAWAAIAKSMVKNIMLHQDAYRKFIATNLEEFNALTTSMPGWDGFHLNTYWTGAQANAYGFACNPQAIAVGAGLALASPNRAAAGVNATTVTLPGIGISVELQEWFATNTKTDWANWELMFGAALGDGSAGVIIKSS